VLRGDRARVAARRPGRYFLIDGAISLASTAWFVVAVLDTILSPNLGAGRWILDSFFLCLAYLYPPLIMHSVLAPHRADGRLSGGPWKGSVIATYLASVGLSALCLLGFWRVVEILPRSPLRARRSYSAPLTTSTPSTPSNSTRWTTS